MPDLITLTRQELYELVWSEPVAAIAARYGITGRGLAKMCERRQVPVPPRGYWARPAIARSGLKRDLPPVTEATSSVVPRKVRGNPEKRDTLQDLRDSMQDRTKLLPDPEPTPEPDRPTRDYSFNVMTWNWRYQVGAQGPEPTFKTSQDEICPEFEDIDMEGLLTEPTELKGQRVSLSIEPYTGNGIVSFRETSRAHVGSVEIFDTSLAARCIMPAGAASRLMQMLIAGRPVEVMLTTEPDDQKEEIIVTISFNGQRIR